MLYHVPLCPLQLVKEVGSNMWVMKETAGPSSDPPPTSHLRQKVHAQQSTAHSEDRPTKEQDATSLRIAGMYCVLTNNWCGVVCNCVFVCACMSLCMCMCEQSGCHSGTCLVL